MIFEFIDSKSKQLEKRIQTIADDYRKNYEAETIFIVIARTSDDELVLSVWDSNEINKWIKEYPTEYGHVCSWNIDRKRTTQDKEKFQISENLYRDDLYQKNNDIYTNAIRTYIEEKKGVAIVLGAGVSKEQGAKTWDELLREFQTEIERQHLLDDSEAVFQEVGGTSLTTAQLCKDVWADEKTFAWQIHKSLYDKARELDVNTELGEIAQLAQKCLKDHNLRILNYNNDGINEQ